MLGTTSMAMRTRSVSTLTNFERRETVSPLRLLWLRTLARVAEEPGAADGPAGHVFLGALTRRMGLLHGRPGLSRSLACVYAAAVARFLRCNIAGHTLTHRAAQCTYSEIALSHDGTTLYAAAGPLLSAYCVADGQLLRSVHMPAVCGSNAGHITDVVAAPCGSVLVAEQICNTVLVLSSDLKLQWHFKGMWGTRSITIVCGLCASASAAYVSAKDGAVFAVCLRTRTQLRRFQLSTPMVAPVICYVECDGNACLAAMNRWTQDDTVMLFCGVTGTCLRRVQLPSDTLCIGLCWRASTNELFVSALLPKRHVFALDLDGDADGPARVHTVARRASFGIAVSQECLFVSRRHGLDIVV